MADQAIPLVADTASTANPAGTDPAQGQGFKDNFVQMATEMLPGMTVTELAELLRYQDALETQIALPEAAASVSAYYVTENGGEFLMTVRGLDPETAYRAFNNFDQSHLEVRLKTRSELPAKGAPAYTSVTVTPSAGAGTAQSMPMQATQTASSATGATVTSGPGAASGDLIVGPALTLEATVTNGKTLWGIKVGTWKYAVRVWPEVLAAAGMKVEGLDPLKTYNLGPTENRPGWIATCTKNEKGYPAKVIKLANG